MIDDLLLSREAHTTRQDIVKQWENSVRLLRRRDLEIESITQEIEK